MRVVGTVLAAIGASWIAVFGSSLCYGVYQSLHGDGFEVTITNGGPALPHWLAYTMLVVLPAIGLLPLIVGFKLAGAGKPKP